MTKSDYIDSIEKNGNYVFVTLGNSMWPIMKNGKQKAVLVKKQGRLSKYDVAMFCRKDGSCVLHRVIEVTSSGYYFCGDSQTVMEKVNEKDVFAVMEGFFTGNKYLSSKDSSYIKRVEKWYASKWRKTILRFFYKSISIKNTVKKVFGSKKGCENG